MRCTPPTVGGVGGRAHELLKRLGGGENSNPNAQQAPSTPVAQCPASPSENLQQAAHTFAQAQARAQARAQALARERVEAQTHVAHVRAQVAAHLRPPTHSEEGGGEDDEDGQSREAEAEAEAEAKAEAEAESCRAEGHVREAQGAREARERSATQLAAQLRRDHGAAVEQLRRQLDEDAALHAAEEERLRRALAADREQLRGARRQLQQLEAAREAERAELVRWREGEAAQTREQLEALQELRAQLRAAREAEQSAEAREAAWRARLDSMADERRLEQAEQQGARERMHAALAELEQLRGREGECRAVAARAQHERDTAHQRLALLQREHTQTDGECARLRHELVRMERLVYGTDSGIAASAGGGGGGASEAIE
eukprot:g2906.t1